MSKDDAVTNIGRSFSDLPTRSDCVHAGLELGEPAKARGLLDAGDVLVEAHIVEQLGVVVHHDHIFLADFRLFMLLDILMLQALDHILLLESLDDLLDHSTIHKRPNDLSRLRQARNLRLGNARLRMRLVLCTVSSLLNTTTALAKRPNTSARDSPRSLSSHKAWQASALLQCH